MSGEMQYAQRQDSQDLESGLFLSRSVPNGHSFPIRKHDSEPSVNHPYSYRIASSVMML